ncbi:putative very-long-chain 3-oxoacyl-CoA synthase [Medicago truncatula]|uniref:3-ketoacyl-CoA synthase n=2 Tax=Medicago truncatula TaxID=3880 RepID=G7J3L2_MEDTR|nr:3-ketoacyl-CoA synthase-like protein [Medicago truncatula]RHN68542.1 putative very-long-chain 3-oxoacyl-CoA synthase [Medicago truncatula]
MEATSKQNHDPVNECTNFTLFSNHLLSKLSYFLWLCSITLATFAQTFLLLQNYELIMFHFLFLCFLLLSFFVKHFLSKPSPIYLVDFSCLKPPRCCRVPFSAFIENASLIESCFDSESIDYMKKVLYSSGQSEDTCLPPSLHYIPPKTKTIESIKEAHMVLFPIMDDLFAKTNILPIDIDMLILNCSGFCPSPSLTAIVVNKYCMRSDIKSYNVSGMGCSASAICIDLAHNLLRVHKNANVIVLSTEILSNGWYPGKERSKLHLNCTFRMGSAAILLSNKKEASKTAKYKLVRSLRTQRAFDDKAYFSCRREEDSDGKLGVTLNKDVAQAAGETLLSNISTLGSEILPLSEKFWYVVSMIKERFIKSEGIYVPDFKTVIQHFILPSPGRGVIRGVGKRLKLGERDMEAALMTLHRFGNQSSSSLWYELAYLEAKEKVQKGDNIWLLGIGSGTKCCSVVLKCNRPKLGESNKGPWSDCIHQYPISTFN